MRKLLAHCFLAASLSALSFLASAEVITFDDVDEQVFLEAGDSFSEDGFTLSVERGNLFSIELPEDSEKPTPAFNTGLNDFPSLDDAFSIFADDGGAFSLLQLDLASFDGDLSDTLSIFGVIGNTLTLQPLFEINSSQDAFSTLTLNTGFFDGFTFVVSEIGEEALFIDNILLQRLDDPAFVSQPSIVALFGLSLLYLIAKSRKGRNKIVN